MTIIMVLQQEHKDLPFFFLQEYDAGDIENCDS